MFESRCLLLHARGRQRFQRCRQLVVRAQSSFMVSEQTEAYTGLRAESHCILSRDRRAPAQIRYLKLRFRVDIMPRPVCDKPDALCVDGIPQRGYLQGDDSLTQSAFTRTSDHARATKSAKCNA